MRVLSMSLNKKGQTSIVMILSLGLFMVSLLGYYATSLQDKKRAVVENWEKISTCSTAQSTFALMEAAMERRMWSMPPDATCKQKLFNSVRGELAGGVQYEVLADYEPKLRVIRMVSRAWQVGSSSACAFRKDLKVLDASDFLFATNSPNGATFESGAFNGQVGALIAGTRKIYSAGPIQLMARRGRSPAGASGPVASEFPQTPTDAKPLSHVQDSLGVILQAERIYALGGISYVSRADQSPNGPAIPFNPPHAGNNWIGPDMLNWWQNQHQLYRGEPGGGGALITGDVAKAEAVRNMTASRVVPSQFSGTTGRSNLFKSVYPKALFTNQTTIGGYQKLHAQNGVDDGNFHQGPDNWTSIFYNYGGAANFWTQVDVTCLSDNNDDSGTKRCSKSGDFPMGFRAWKTNAELDSVLFTDTSSEQISLPEVNWDHMAALREDAEACGFVVTPTSTPTVYEDCNLSDTAMMGQYLLNPGVNPCKQIRELDLDATIKNEFNYFSENEYKDPDNENLLLRRVIYSESPTRITQTSATGIAATGVNSVTDPEARKRLSIWFVGGDFVVQPFQPDVTSPLNVNPGVVRRLFFNRDGTNNALRVNPLQLVFLTPDPITIIAPQHVNTSFADLQSMYPVVAGRIVPTRHIFTDDARHEGNGYLYGVRNIEMENIALMTSANLTNDKTFFLQGLWSALDDQSGTGELVNACMMDLPGDNLARRAGDANFVVDGNPEAADLANLPLPESVFWRNAGSAFCNAASPNAAGCETDSGYPWVFRVQQQAGVTSPVSQVQVTGIRFLLKFSNQTPTGKRNLNSPASYGDIYLTYEGSGPTYNWSPFDLSDRRYNWPHPYYWDMPTGLPAPDNTAPRCNKDNLFARGFAGNPAREQWLRIYTNKSGGPLIQLNPTADFKNLGSIASQDLPVVKSVANLPVGFIQDDIDDRDMIFREYSQVSNVHSATSDGYTAIESPTELGPQN